MNQESCKIKSFTDLNAWKEGHMMVLDIYEEKSQFYSIALGSVTEIQSQLLISRDVKYISKEEFDRIAQKTIIVNKLINGLLKKTRSIIRDS